MAIYGMVDLNVTNWWRLTAGVRQENFTQRFQSGYSTQRPGGGTLDNEYKYANLLPSTNMIFKLNEKK